MLELTGRSTRKKIFIRWDGFNDVLSRSFIQSSNEKLSGFAFYVHAIGPSQLELWMRDSSNDSELCLFVQFQLSLESLLEDIRNLDQSGAQDGERTAIPHLFEAWFNGEQLWNQTAEERILVTLEKV